MFDAETTKKTTKMSNSTTVIKTNSTHEARIEGGEIKIYLRAFGDEAATVNGILYEAYQYAAEYLYSMLLERKEDLDTIFDGYDEDNRVNVAEANAELN